MRSKITSKTMFSFNSKRKEVTVIMPQTLCLFNAVLFVPYKDILFVCLLIISVSFHFWSRKEMKRWKKKLQLIVM